MLKTIRSRVLATLLLSPALLLLLVWVGRFAGSDEVARMGIVQFSIWAFGAALGISATVTLYIAFLTKSDESK